MSPLLPLLVLASGRLAGIEPEPAFSFTDEEASVMIGQIELALGEYGELAFELTSAAGADLPSRLREAERVAIPGLLALSDLETLDFDVISFGFVNWMNWLHGYILSKDLEIARLRLEVLRLSGAPACSVEAAESTFSELSGRFVNGYLINYGRME